MALGDKQENAYLEIDNANPGHSRIVLQNGKNSVSNVYVSTLAQFAPLLGTRTIKLLKMDVEGSAMRIITCGSRILRNLMIRNIVAEMHRGEEGPSATFVPTNHACALSCFHPVR